jgi:hypothetical protein
VKPRLPALALPALLAASLAGCGGTSLWPFGGTSSAEVSRKPANATEYACSGGKSFYVRSLDANAVWLIAPDREIRLDKKADGRWSFGRVELDISGDTANLNDPPTVMAGCKRAA